MSWDSYITNMKAKGLQTCGIYGLEGGAWAKSPEMNASQTEMVNIVRGIQTGDFSKGLFINGVKYTVISFTKDSVTAKCREAPNEAEKYLLHVALAKTCAVVGGIAGAGERSATMFVEDIRDYLAKASY